MTNWVVKIRRLSLCHRQTRVQISLLSFLQSVFADSRLRYNLSLLYGPQTLPPHQINNYALYQSFYWHCKHDRFHDTFLYHFNANIFLRCNLFPFQYSLSFRSFTIWAMLAKKNPSYLACFVRPPTLSLSFTVTFASIICWKPAIWRTAV